MAFGIALDPLRRSMRLVTHRRTDRASETTCKYDTFLSFLFGIRPRRPSARWRRPVASREALDPLYRSMSAVSCRRIYSSVETARTEVHLFVFDDRAIDLNLAD